MITVVATLLAVSNLAVFLMFWWDKDAARRGLRRIPERSLLGVAALGGGLGALLAQRLLRHKTRKQPFRAQLLLIALAQIVLAGLLLLPGVRLGLARLLGL